MIVDFNSETWTDPWVRTLTTEQKLLFVYLWSNSHKNTAGLYALDTETMSFETGLPKEDVESALDALGPKVRYDQGKKIVWVVNHVKHQFCKSGKLSPKMALGIIKNVISFKPHPFVEKFLAYYPIVMHTLSDYQIPYPNTGYSPGTGEGEDAGKGEREIPERDTRNESRDPGDFVPKWEEIGKKKR